MVTYDGKAFHRVKYQPKLDNQNFPTGHYIQTNSEQTTIHGTYLDDIKHKVDQNGENELQIAVKKIVGWGIHAILTDKKEQYYLLTNSVQHLPPLDHQFGSFYDALLAILLKLGYVNNRIGYDDEENPTEIIFTITPRDGLAQSYLMYFYSPDRSCYYIS